MVTDRPRTVYLPISQWGLPLARDVAIVLIARVCRIRVAIHLHGSQLVRRLTRGGAVGSFLRRSLRSADWAVLSTRLQTELQERGFESVRVLLNPVATEEDVPEKHTTAWLGVGFLGQICEEKGADIVLASVRELRARSGARVRAVMAGPIGNVELKAEPPDVSLGPLRSEALDQQFWSLVDVLLLPARWEEGLPFVVLEGLTRGRLVASSASGGLADLIECGAVAVVRSDTQSCANFLELCLAEGNDTRNRQQEAWRTVRHQFEPDPVLSQWLRFVDSGT